MNEVQVALAAVGNVGTLLKGCDAAGAVLVDVGQVPHGLDIRSCSCPALSICRGGSCQCHESGDEHSSSHVELLTGIESGAL